MKRYLRLYREIIIFCLKREIEFRLNFLLNVFAFSLWTISGYVVTLVAYGYSGSFAGWDEKQMLLFITIFNLANSLLKFSLYNNLTHFSEKMRSGDFDAILLKPVSARFTISASRVRFEQIPRTIVFVVLIIVFGLQANPHMNFFNIFFGFLTIIIGIFAMYNFLFIIACYALWKPRVWNTFSIIESVEELSDKPRNMYKGIMFYIVTILPLAAFSTIPAKFFLGEGSVPLFIESLGLMLVFFYLSNIVWKAGLKHYESASS
ncbi:ABC-2 family transporter protein [Candidatus Dojkabacteria bacterium]|nr:ABC-2 family transporter protein [Candidatus Dojkabacteria bacterium]